MTGASGKAASNIEQADSSARPDEQSLQIRQNTTSVSTIHDSRIIQITQTRFGKLLVGLGKKEFFLFSFESSSEVHSAASARFL